MDRLNPSPPGYDSRNALALARASSLAYATADEIRRDVAANGAIATFVQSRESPTSDLRDADAQGFVAHWPDQTVLVFRGTESGRDWETNTNLLQVDEPWGKVHCGFQKALDSLWPQVQAALAASPTLPGMPRQLWLAGHSLGGAMALLAAGRFARMGPQTVVRACYTYGQPRVGNGVYTTAHDAQLRPRTFRHRNHRDIVTHLPPDHVGYEHAGTHVYFDVGGTRTIEPSHMGTIRTLLHRPWNIFRRLVSNPIAEHGIKEYIHKLKWYAERGI